jgi:hypothetical protein
MRPAVASDGVSGAGIVAQAIRMSALPLADFARLVLSTSPQKVQAWASGTEPVPDDVLRLLSWFVSMATTEQRTYLKTTDAPPKRIPPRRNHG